MLELFYLLLLLSEGIILFNFIKRDKISVFLYSSFFITLFYIIVPLVFIGVSSGTYFSNFYNKHFSFSSSNLWLSFIITFIFLCFFNLTYYISTRKQGFVLRKRKILSKEIFFIGVKFAAIISCGALVIYILGFGGFEEAFSKANSVRSGYYKTEAAGDTSHTFFKRFIFLALIPILYFWNNSGKLTIYSNKLKKLMYYYAPLITLLFFYFFLNRGRQRIIDFFLIFFIFDYLKNRKIKWKLLIPLSIISAIFINYLEIIFAIRNFEDFFNVITS